MTNRATRIALLIDNGERLEVRRLKTNGNLLVMLMDSQIDIEITPEAFELMSQKARDAKVK